MMPADDTETAAASTALGWWPQRSIVDVVAVLIEARTSAPAMRAHLAASPWLADQRKATNRKPDSAKSMASRMGLMASSRFTGDCQPANRPR